MQRNKYHSYHIGKLANGCKLCVTGEKTVVYITGVCPRKCFYCPLSEQKKNNDVMYANERKVKQLSEVVEEAKTCSSKGLGITGGDPLARFERTIEMIKLAKKKDKKSHIHLYTSPDLLSESKLKELEKAGLDEIRVHPDLYDEKIWPKVKLLDSISIDKGIEIPMIPGREDMIKKMINCLRPHVNFINLNEFEYSDMNETEMHSRNFYCRSAETYAIEQSREAGIKILSWIKKTHPKLNAHFCTAKLKDATQISNRLKRRAKAVAQPFDVVDEDGMLIRGAIIGATQADLRALAKKYRIPKQLIKYDPERKQILIAAWVLQDIFQDLEFECQIITEYPTYDRMIVEADILKKIN